ISRRNQPSLNRLRSCECLYKHLPCVGRKSFPIISSQSHSTLQPPPGPLEGAESLYGGQHVGKRVSRELLSVHFRRILQPKLGVSPSYLVQLSISHLALCILRKRISPADLIVGTPPHAVHPGKACVSIKAMPEV